ncbi:MAG TPA: hypothetical protein VN758_10375 [Solirubrobacterales bacterium]|nr:hypothetical protein [Solirubrobacterales bacterium]
MKSQRNGRVSKAVILSVGLFIALAIGAFALLGIGQMSTSSAHIAGKSDSALKVLAAAHHGSKKRCHPGQQASLRLQRIPPGAGTKMRSKVLIIACGSVSHYGPVEIVGYDTSDGFCYATDSLTQEASEGGLCIAEDSDWQTFCKKGAVCPGNVTWTSVDGTPYFQLSGMLAPEVTQVRVTVSKPAGGTRVVRGIVGQPDSKLRTSLNLVSRFGIFALISQGCPPSKGVKVVGYDKAGNMVEVSRSVNLLPGSCSSKRQSHGAVMVIRSN